MNYKLSHLQQLEAEAIYVIREAASQFEKMGLLFSGGKNSVVVLHLCRKAFYPNKLPFPLLHIDTGHNYDEAIKFRDYLVEKLGLSLEVRYVQDSINEGKVKEETGFNASRNSLQSVTLLGAIEELQLDACLGGARRDEEKARAKERFFSHRNEFGEWEPKNQRPELWNLYNGKKEFGENFRVFPLSNWTEMDVWQYIKQEHIELPSLYFSHKRDCVIRNGIILGTSPYLTLKEGENVQKMQVRFRTLGDATCTGAFLSDAVTVDEIIQEVSKKVIFKPKITNLDYLTDVTQQKKYRLKLLSKYYFGYGCKPSRRKKAHV